VNSMDKTVLGLSHRPRGSCGSQVCCMDDFDACGMNSEVVGVFCRPRRSFCHFIHPSNLLRGKWQEVWALLFFL
jgi:hypothetical protein